MNNKKNKSKSFFENFSWTFVGSIIYAISQWLLIVILAKYGSAEIVGQFSLGMVITAPIIMFFNMQLRSILATDSLNKYSFPEYFGTNIILLILSLIIIILISIIGMYQIEVLFIIILVGISKIIESLSEITHGYFQKIERMDYAGKSMIYKAISSLLSFSIIYIIFENLIVSLIGLIIAWLSRLIFYDLKNARKYTIIKPSFNKFKIITIFAMPLGIVAIINSLNTNIPRYFLEKSEGLDVLGYFSAIAYILVAGSLLIRPLSLVAAPRLAKSYQENNKKNFLKITMYLLLFSLIIGILTIIFIYYFGESLLTIVYDESYAEFNHILLIILIGSTFSYFTTFLNSSIVAAREFKKQPYINIITMIVGLISSVLIIPNYGIEGAAYVTVIVYVTQFIGSTSLFIMILRKK